MRFGLSFLLLVSTAVVSGFDVSSNNNVVVYWGQQGGSLADACADPGVDVVVLAFLTTFFGTGGLPEVNFAGACTGPTFPGSDLLECDQIGEDIKTCQAAGKAVLLSLGGADGTYGFSSASQAQSFATTLWEVFGEGSCSTRTFGSAVVDGFDLDIENNEPDYYSDFITAMRSLFATGTKQYYITGAPQCVFPDASLGQALDSSSFDMVFVQFYNNPCGVASGSAFNFDTWQTWATSQSPNKNVKVYVGVPASSEAASSGYISPSALQAIISSVASDSSFGGIMMWDYEFAEANVEGGVNYALAAKNALGGGSASSPAQVSSSPSSTLPNAGSSSVPIYNSVVQPSVGASVIPAGPSVIPAYTAPNVGASSAGAYPTVAPVGGSSAPIYNPPATVQPMNGYTTLQTVHHHSLIPGVGKGRSTSAAAAPAATTPSESSLSCTTDGAMDCVDGKVAQCVGGQYILTSCGEGTVCTKIAIDGGESVITCDYQQSSGVTNKSKCKRNLDKRHGHRRAHVLIGSQ